MLKESLVKYLSVAFLLGFFVLITIVGLRECEKQEEVQYVVVEEQYVMVDDIIFEVFMGEDYDGEMD